MKRATIATSDGVIPGIRAAIPNVRGRRMREFFARFARQRPDRCVVEIAGNRHAFGLCSFFDRHFLAPNVSLAFDLDGEALADLRLEWRVEVIGDAFETEPWASKRIGEHGAGVKALVIDRINLQAGSVGAFSRLA